MDYISPILIALAIAVPVGLFILLVYVIANERSEFDFISMLRQFISNLRDLLGK